MMKKLSYYCKIVLLTWAGSTSAFAHAQIMDMQINDLISKAINTHPLVKSAMSEQKATQEGINAAKKSLLPTPNVTTGYQEGRRLKSQVSLRQPLWTGGRLTANVNQAIFDDKAAVERVFEQQNQVAKNTIDAWEVYVTAISMQRVYEENLKQLSVFEAMMSRRVKQGVSAKIELDLMNNRILQQQNSYQAAKEQEKIALARLEQIVGEKFATGNAFTIPPLATLTQKVKIQAKNYEKMVFDEASFRNATVVKEYFQVESAKQSLQADKAASYPTVFAEYTHMIDLENQENDGKFSFGMNYDPGAGFSNVSLQKASEAKVESLVQSQEASRRTVMQDIQTKYQNFASAKDKEVSLIAAKAGNQMVVDSYRRQFIAGRKSWLEVLNAIREQNDNQIELVKTRTTMLGSFYSLQIDLGMMPWQEFQINRQPQPLFHALDPLEEWMSTQDYVDLPESIQSIPRSIKSVPNHLRNLKQKLNDNRKQKFRPSKAFQSRTQTGVSKKIGQKNPIVPVRKPRSVEPPKQKKTVKPQAPIQPVKNKPVKKLKPKLVDKPKSAPLVTVADTKKMTLKKPQSKQPTKQVKQTKPVVAVKKNTNSKPLKAVKKSESQQSIINTTDSKSTQDKPFKTVADLINSEQ